MKRDRRSVTSRKNLGRHVPEVLDPDGVRVLSVRVPVALARSVDAAADGLGVPRSAWLRRVLERAVQE